MLGICGFLASVVTNGASALRSVRPDRVEMVFWSSLDVIELLSGTTFMQHGLLVVSIFPGRYT